MKNLSNFGVQEMNKREMREAEGGFLGLEVIITIAAIVVGVIKTIKQLQN